MQITKERFVRFWLPPLVWTGVILALSGGGGSSEHSGSLLSLVLPFLGEDALQLTNLVLRKMAHVLAYALLGWLNFRAVRAERSGWRVAWSVAAVIMAALVATLDEWHQSTTSVRTGHVADVLLDTGSAVLAQVFARSR